MRHAKHEPHRSGRQRWALRLYERGTKHRDHARIAEAQQRYSWMLQLKLGASVEGLARRGMKQTEQDLRIAPQ